MYLALIGISIFNGSDFINYDIDDGLVDLRIRGVDFDSDGNIYLTGITEGQLDGNTHLGSQDIFLMKYNSSGTKQWTKQTGNSYSNYAFGLAVDPSSNVIYVTGLNVGTLDGQANSGGNDIFLIKYNFSQDR